MAAPKSEVQPDPRGWRRVGCLLALLAVALLIAGVIGFVRVFLSVANQQQAYSLMRIHTHGVLVYHDQTGHWPSDLHDVLERRGVLSHNVESYLENPVRGYSGFRLVLPEQPLDELEEPSKIPLLYEVREDGTIDPHGLIGYADGHVASSSRRFED
ncbi:MAG: hypothetical protein AAGE65_09420 [Planctomycetota bacterium]